MAYRLTKSAPAVVYHDEAEDDDEPGARRLRSIGTDGTSPSAYQALMEMHYSFLGAYVVAHPRVKAEIWRGRVYTMIEFHPELLLRDGRDLPALQPDAWHTTVCVAYYPVDIPWRELTLQAAFMWWRRQIKVDQLHTMANRVFEFVTGSPPHMDIQLTRPPWRKSFTFGIAYGAFLCALLVVRELAEAWCITQGYRLRKQRPVHVSWR